MASATPAGALTQKGRVILTPDDDASADLLLLEMAPEAQRRVALAQELRIDGAVRPVADGASLAHRFVDEYVRAALGGMAGQAGLAFAQQCRAAPFHGRAFVWRVAIAAGDPAFEDRVMAGGMELSALVEMTLKADLG